MSAYQKLRVTDDGAVRTIALHNPTRRNALGGDMVAELERAFGEAWAASSVRCIVLTGSAEGKAFSAGGDFSQMNVNGGTALTQVGDFGKLLIGVLNTEKPIVARVNGAAMGGGLGLVASSSFAVATTDVMFGTPEVHSGIFPMMIMPALARIIPKRRLLEMILLGQRIDSAEGLELGLVNRVVSPGELDGAVKGITDQLIAQSPVTVALGLRSYAEMDDLSFEHALPLLQERLKEMLATEDAREGLTAFLEKRRPVWKGR